MRGEFEIFDVRPAGTPVEIGEKPLVVPNSLVAEGGIAYLRMIFQGDNTVIGLGQNYYLGGCAQTPEASDSLSSISTEPAFINGYSRPALIRNSTGFPVIDVVNGVARAQSALATFTATGGNFTLPISRLFLCSVATGYTGTLFAYTGALESAITLAAGDSLPVRYNLYWD